MFNTIKVRQGALVCKVAPDGKVTYEICLPVPSDFFMPFQLGEKARIVVSNNGKRKYVTKQFDADLQAATIFKLCVQDAVTSYKMDLLKSRKQNLSDRLNKVLNNNP